MQNNVQTGKAEVVRVDQTTLVLLGAMFILPILFFAALFIIRSEPINRESNGAVAGVQAEGSVMIKVTSSSITPSEITIPAGKKVQLIAENAGAAGCTSALVSRDLFEGSLIMGAAGDSVETTLFAPTPGEYKITCTMGMVEMKVRAI